MNQKEWMQRIAGIKPKQTLNESIGGVISFRPLREESEENSWMYDVDGSDEYSYGNWKCGYEHPGVLRWAYGDIPFGELEVVATPNYDGDNKTVIKVLVNEGDVEEYEIDNGLFKNFEEYVDSIANYLDQIEDNYVKSDSNIQELSPKQKKIAKLDPPADELDAGDFKKLRGMKEAEDEEPGMGDEEGPEWMEEEIDMNEYDQLLRVIEDLLKSGESEADIMKVVKDQLGVKENYMGTSYDSLEDMVADMVKKGIREDDDMGDDDAHYAAYQEGSDMFRKAISKMRFHEFDDDAIHDAFMSALDDKEMDEQQRILGRMEEKEECDECDRASGELDWNM